MEKLKHPIDLLPAYALGSLGEGQRIQVAAHLGACAACRKRIAAYERVVAKLATATPVQRVPTKIKGRLLDQVRQRPLASGIARNAKPAQINRRIPVYALLGAVLIFGLSIGNILLWRELQQQRAIQGSTLVAIHLDNTGSVEAGQGLLVLSADRQYATLIVEDLPRLDPDQQYQFWLIQGGAPISAGVFSVNADGYSAIPVFSATPITSYTAYGVSIEPYGGSAAPTGDIVLYKELDA